MYVSGMKKTISSFLILFFLAATFIPFLNVSVADVLHLSHEAQNNFHSPGLQAHTHSHVKHTHSHEKDTVEGSAFEPVSGHSARVDIVTFFNDYLHVDLKRPSSADTISFSGKDRQYDIADAIILPPPHVDTGTRGHSSARLSSLHLTALSQRIYLTTLRLRI